MDLFLTEAANRAKKNNDGYAMERMSTSGNRFEKNMIFNSHQTNKTNRINLSGGASLNEEDDSFRFNMAKNALPGKDFNEMGAGAKSSMSHNKMQGKKFQQLNKEGSC